MNATASTPARSDTFPLQDRLSLLGWSSAVRSCSGRPTACRSFRLPPGWGPLLMVRFLRTQKALVGLVIGYLINTAAFYFQWYAAFQDAGAMFSAYTAVFGLLFYLPYVADRLLRPRLPGFASTLAIVPAAWVTVETMLHLVLPLGTFFNLAYTQHSNLPLLQVMSVTGLWGVSFLVTWFAGIANYA